MMKYFLLLLFILSIYSVTPATTRFVSKTGTSTPPYTTWAAASDSIQKCIDICSNGDTIYVDNGIYKEYLNIHKDITLIGSSMDSTVIDSRNLFHIWDRDTTILITTPNSEIRNFQLIGAGRETTTIIITLAFQNEFRIDNCKLQNASNGFSIGNTKAYINNVIIYNCFSQVGFRTLQQNQDSLFVSDCLLTLSQNDITAISSIGGSRSFIYRNILLAPQNSSTGILLTYDRITEIKNNLISGFNNSGILDMDEGTYSAIIHNNVFLNADIYAHVDWDDGSNLSFKNNILAYNRRGAVKVFQGTPVSDYNIYWNNHYNVSGVITMGEHDLIVDPMFVNDVPPHSNPDYDLRLQKYSPGIDAGDPSILDVDGSRSDIGIYGGPLGEKYTYEDLAPRTPRQLKAVLDTALNVTLSWLNNTEADFNEYRLYRDTVSNFSITESNLIYSGKLNSCTDSLGSVTGNLFYYKVTAVDSQSNQSAPSASVTIRLTGVEPMVINNDYLLYNNYPNPFNPSTKIGFHLKQRSYVKLMVYDIKGELVNVLVNSEKEAGYHEVLFNASVLNSHQNEKEFGTLASGIYLYRLEVIDENRIPVYSEMKKMVLLK